MLFPIPASVQYISVLSIKCVCFSSSFHVGSGAQSASAYAKALASAKEAFTAAVSLYIA